VYLLSTAAVAEYYGDGDELHLAFNFPPLYAPWRPGPWRECIEATVGALDPRGAWPTWVLSNHDNPRHRSRYDRGAAASGEDAAVTARRSEARARAAAVLLLTLRGTPFLYQGEELGLVDAVVPPERRVDPGGRDGCRAPIPWTGAGDFGWASVDGTGPWLPFPPEPEVRNYEDQCNDPASVLNLYRRLIAVRHHSPALSLGGFDLLDLPDGLLGYRRRHGSEAMAVIVNFTGRAVDGTRPSVEPGLRVLVSSDGIGEGRTFDGVVGADQAVVLTR